MCRGALKLHTQTRNFIPSGEGVVSVTQGHKGKGIDALWRGGRGSEKSQKWCYVIYEQPLNVKLFLNVSKAKKSYTNFFC